MSVHDGIPYISRGPQSYLAGTKFCDFGAIRKNISLVPRPHPNLSSFWGGVWGRDYISNSSIVPARESRSLCVARALVSCLDIDIDGVTTLYRMHHYSYWGYDQVFHMPKKKINGLDGIFKQLFIQLLF
jgi:hypothetical protein